MEWISKRAYSLWEEAGRPHGQDMQHWAQAEREREEFDRAALPAGGGKKPLIEISGTARARKADAGPEKPAASRTTAKAKTTKTAGSKPI